MLNASIRLSPDVRSGCHRVADVAQHRTAESRCFVGIHLRDHHSQARCKPPPDIRIAFLSQSRDEHRRGPGRVIRVHFVDDFIKRTGRVGVVVIGANLHGSRGFRRAGGRLEPRRHQARESSAPRAHGPTLAHDRTRCPSSRTTAEPWPSRDRSSRTPARPGVPPSMPRPAASRPQRAGSFSAFMAPASCSTTDLTAIGSGVRHDFASFARPARQVSPRPELGLSAQRLGECAGESGRKLGNVRRQPLR